MTLFYSSSTNQEETMSNLYPREPPCAAYSDMPFQGNMIYLHSSSSSCIMDSHGSSNAAADLVATRFSENEMLSIQTVDDGSANNDSHLSVLSGQNFSLGGSNFQGQGLSLSLCTQGTVPSFHHLPVRADISFSVPNQLSSVSDKEDLRIRHEQLSSLHSTIPYLTSSGLNFDYLKAAQELLNEVVNVGNALKLKGGKDHGLEADLGFKSSGAPLISQGDDNGVSSNELSASEKQDFQNKAARLIEMVDEVDRRYKQYYHQMQIIVSSFDVVAGAGSAKPYTMLALQTISRHFRCLRDAISSQIHITRRKLGEQESGDSVRLCRLRHIDQQLRQRRIAQQYGVMQSHAWRPQRGLPENSVSILRAWLFEHFLHPYPKDSEKLMLARQTGLTRSQVSNWFINARVRLWKPMIEEMHREELGDDTDMDSRSSLDKLSVDRKEPMQGAENGKLSHSGEPSRSIPIHDLDTSGSDAQYNHQPAHEKLTGEDDDGGGRIMAYQMSELGHYEGNMVSLTLGLQHWEANTGAYDFESMGGDRHHGCGPLHFMQDFAL